MIRFHLIASKMQLSVWKHLMQFIINTLSMLICSKYVLFIFFFFTMDLLMQISTNDSMMDTCNYDFIFGKIRYLHNAA